MKVVASTRTAQGSSASRRLRHEGQVPGILYGNGAAVNLSVEHNPLWHALQKEAFHSSVLDLEIDGKSEKALLRDFQLHAYKKQVLHIDFQRVDPNQKLHVKVPLHFKNQENSPAVKLSGGLVSHIITEIDVTCLPAALPEFIEVDLGELQAGHALHVSHIKFPAGVSPVLHGKEDPVIVTVQVKGGAEDAKPAAEAAKK
ncbi:50S ribosomal protein L25/general stress protein Ctc [Parvibium lacunae]|uniref:Large ribosomal subunit protein bL25 n=1 Tax=Parvibium lacunae TaxID=1888893 RepID=A0A368L0Z5_9BURK|nr:50S ribosomal protein L25/general stress protein Ctc [Parvibium lacunae]RCS56974.1 50S ribosomal protein L25/general stress protein Ctc [Parvibium lacunae]